MFSAAALHATVRLPNFEFPLAVLAQLHCWGARDWRCTQKACLNGKGAWIMSITLTARRVLTTAATLALLAAAPGLTGVASASDHHGTSHAESTCSASQLVLTADQQKGVDAAIAGYDTAVRSAKDTMKSTMAGIRDKVMADPTVVSTRAVMITAHDAYEAAEHTTSEPALELAYENAEKAYHDALKAARVVNQTAAETAVTAYRTAVTSAETAYTAALTSVFGTAAAIPAQLVYPDGHDSRGYHGNDVRNGHNRSHDDSLTGDSSSAYDYCEDSNDDDEDDD
jgi:Asp/Glu/hydantoin racemase